MRFERLMILAGLPGLLGMPVSAAQPTTTSVGVPAFEARRAPQSPTVDGDLGEAVWQTAVEISGFTQRDPDEGKPATERTVVKVVYDDEAIYFGAQLDDSAPVTSRLGRRDASLESDWFRVYLDPHDDHRTGSSFWVNPANVQTDLTLYDDNRDNLDWDGVWSSATRVTDRGWTVEMRIPFSQLRFPDRPTHTWGVNFVRRISRNNEQDHLVYVPKNETGFVSRFAHLVGISGIKPPRAMELMPYVVTRADVRNTIEDADPYNSTAEVLGDLGVDVKYGLTSNLTLTGSVNPDFGQVEVDPAVLNLTQFELFFPEKRPFFVEGASLFDFGKGGSNNNFNFNLNPPSFFYSRRIGRQPQGTINLDYDYIDVPEQSTILAAAKVTGKTASGWTVAALDAVTDQEKAFYSWEGLRHEDAVEPMTNYFIARSAKDLGEKGRLGFLLTSVNRDVPEELDYLRSNSYSGGVDGYWTFGDRDVLLEWFAGGSYVEGSETAISRTQRSAARYFHRPDAGHVELDSTRTSLEGWGSRVMLAKQTGKWKYNLQAQAYSPGFETNDVGFMSRSDVAATHAVLLYNDPTVRKRTRERGFWMGKYQNWNFDGDLIADGALWDGFVEFKNYWYVFNWGGMNGETVDDRATRGGPAILRPSNRWLGGGFGSNPTRKVWFELWSELMRDSQEGSRSAAGMTLNYRPTSRLSVRLDPVYRTQNHFAQYVDTVVDANSATNGRRYIFGELDQSTFEIGTRLEWTFTSRLSLQLYMQPFVASGDYTGFKEVTRGRSFDYSPYATTEDTLRVTDSNEEYIVDPDGVGPASSFRFDNPDFSLRSMRGNAILRWEFRPGSAVYLVWNENREEEVILGDFRIGHDLSRSFAAPSDDVFLLKMSYWVGL